MRTLSRIPQVRVKYGCDLDESKRTKLTGLYPDTHFAGDFEELLSDDKLRAVVVASLASTHAALARQALLASKDVFVEKPLTLSCSDAEELVSNKDVPAYAIVVGVPSSIVGWMSAYGDVLDFSSSDTVTDSQGDKYQKIGRPSMGTDVSERVVSCLRELVG